MQHRPPALAGAVHPEVVVDQPGPVEHLGAGVDLERPGHGLQPTRVEGVVVVEVGDDAAFGRVEAVVAGGCRTTVVRVDQADPLVSDRIDHLGRGVAAVIDDDHLPAAVGLRLHRGDGSREQGRALVGRRDHRHELLLVDLGSGQPARSWSTPDAPVAPRRWPRGGRPAPQGGRQGWRRAPHPRAGAAESASRRVVRTAGLPGTISALVVPVRHDGVHGGRDRVGSREEVEARAAVDIGELGPQGRGHRGPELGHGHRVLAVARDDFSAVHEQQALVVVVARPPVLVRGGDDTEVG